MKLYTLYASPTHSQRDFVMVAQMETIRLWLGLDRVVREDIGINLAIYPSEHATLARVGNWLIIEGARLPDPLSQALNEGDGTYRP